MSGLDFTHSGTLVTIAFSLLTIVNSLILLIYSYYYYLTYSDIDKNFFQA